MVYNISDKTLVGAKSLRIRFDNVDGFISVCGKTRYLVLFEREKYGATYNRIRYLISQKRDIIFVISHNYARIKVDSYNSILLEKPLTFHNVIILIKSVINKNQNHYYYKTFFKKCLYK